MPKPKPDLTPSLFDQVEAEAVTEVAEDIGNSAEELPEWHEVPAARFLSWSRGMQLQYCYKRDLDAALRAANDTEATFFLERAAGYKKVIDGEDVSVSGNGVAS
jgi:hypothetical protein